MSYVGSYEDMNSLFWNGNDAYDYDYFFSAIPGLVVYYYTHVQDVVQYSDLKTQTLVAFQSVGNAVIIFHLLDQVLSMEEAWNLFQASPFMNILPKPYCASTYGMPPQGTTFTLCL